MRIELAIVTAFGSDKMFRVFEFVSFPFVKMRAIFREPCIADGRVIERKELSEEVADSEEVDSDENEREFTRDTAGFSH